MHRVKSITADSSGDLRPLKGSAITKKDIHVVPHKDGWATRKEGAGRVGVVTSTQKAAIDRAKEQAVRANVEVVIHRKDGRVRDSDSYGNDPNPPRDEKH